MPRKRKLTNLGDRCRFCLARDACMSELFVEWLQPKVENLEKCCSTEILDKPNHPRSVCYVCLYKLEMITEFKTQLLQTNKVIERHFKIVEQTESSIDKESNADNITKDLSCDSQKRPKIDVSKDEPVKLVEENIVEQSAIINEESTPVKSVTEIVISDAAIHQDEDNNASSFTKTHLSDTGSCTTMRKGRSRKIEREGLTKRWEERQKKKFAKAGEVPSESDSDTDAHLSPVQKARAKSNNEKLELMRQKKLQKALKNLETNMTEKYRINQEFVFVEEERKTRSRRTTHDEQLTDNANKVDTTKTLEKKVKSPETTKIIPKENQKKNIKESETQSEIIKEIEKNVIIEKSNKEPEKVTEKKSTNIKKESENKSTVDTSKDVEILEIESDTADTNPQQDKIGTPILPQLVTSEIIIGSTTYLVSMTLDLPNSLTTKSDISLKTNGINVDATSKDGEKIDIMNAVQLQRVKPGDENSPLINKNDKTKVDIHKCLKIEVEGMEVEALQRVQLELVNFINKDIGQLVMGDTLAKRKVDSKPNKFKDSYDSLNHQLKGIIEKVLRNNLESEKPTDKTSLTDKISSPDKTGSPDKTSSTSNNKIVSPEFIKAAAHSSVFQPRVKVSRLNIGKICKLYRINNLHIFEDVKRERGLIGPLSRTLGKRKKVLPKKFQDFSLTLRASDEETTPTKNSITTTTTAKAAVTKADIVNKITNISLDYSSDDAASATAPSSMMAEPPSPVQSLITEGSQTAGSPSSKQLLPSIRRILPALVEKRTISPAVKSKPPITISKTTSLVQSANATVNTSSLTNKASSTPSNTASKTTTIVLKSTPSTASKSLNATSNASSKLPPKKTPVATPAIKNIPISSKSPATLTNNTPKRQRHICGICGKELFSKEEAEAHVKNHKVDSTTLDTTTTTPKTVPLSPLQVQKPKPKLMRCKRCQAIVEAKHVKSHVCNSVKYNCTLCECSFGAEHLLIAHIETHTAQKRRNSISSNKMGSPKDKQKGKESEPEDLENLLSTKDSQGYSCFVCDKVFVDEDQMKDHLQMHCEEVSDDGDEKGFQCAFCGEKFQTEESLETHVGNHLLEDGDEKINMMINLDTRKEKQRKANTFRCERCSESFSSSLLLAMHLPVHEEEEEANNEQEADHNVCTICDEIFDTPEELSEHLDVHNGNAHVCILCEKPFSSIKDLQDHVSTHL